MEVVATETPCFGFCLQTVSNGAVGSAEDATSISKCEFPGFQDHNQDLKYIFIRSVESF